MQWTEDLSVGVPGIDQQHIELFKRITALVDSMKRKECKFHVDPTITFLEEYVIEHFSAEAAVMQKTGYPERDAHMQQHQQFIDNFNQMKQDLAGELSSYTRSANINHIVVDWIIDHIKTVDIRLGAYLSQRDISEI